MKNIKAACISVYWPESWKTVILTPRKWKRVLSGEPIEICGNGYYYEGVFFHDYWRFSGGMKGRLLVEYDDGGTGFIGDLEDAEIEEFDYSREEKLRMIEKWS